jgi:hypothetical protein
MVQLSLKKESINLPKHLLFSSFSICITIRLDLI